jgi:phage terminase large subunit
VKLVNWHDNPWFPDVLKQEMEYCKRVDYDKYLHIWEGKCKGYAEDLIFRNKISVEEFETPSVDRFFFGADFGFSNDPTVLVRMFIQGTTLFIDHEAYGHGVEITELPAFFRSVPEAEHWKIIADCERPDTISYLHNEGFDIEGAEKGKGSVEDGIQFLRSFEKIIIHPRCTGSKDNFENYRWKRDKNTEEILPIPKDGSDHAPDAARYGLESYIKRKVSCWDVI